MSRPRNSSNTTNGTIAYSGMARPKSSGGFSSFTKGSDEEQKTAVKVAIRLRPPLHQDDPNYDAIPARFRKSSCQVPTPTTLSVGSSQGKKTFVFDRVFPDTERQEGVWDYVSGGIDSFVQGYNVSLLAYGQSGAGKSYTMGTSEPTEQQRTGSVGIIPRAAAALFEKLAPERSKQANGTGIRMPKRYSGLPNLADGGAPKKEDKSWQLTATYVEIYNEQLRDLLVSDTIPQNERSNVTIREDAKGKILLTGLKQLPINSIDDLMDALYFGSRIRQTDATAINSKSSRSHAVFSLNLVQKRNRSSTGSVSERRSSSTQVEQLNGDSYVTIDSKLHFVDLAGSERLKNSGLTGERVKEGISINAGLASLGKVISQLSSRTAGSHVSYRDSRLTRMLQDSLGGNAITYMVACVNPVEFHLSETLNTVQYAQRARAIQSKPQIQQRSDEGDKQLIIDRLRSEIKFLREQIRSSQQGDRRKVSSNDRSLRNMERENELQNQLLDIQENYSALSQRHAKLISELTKGKAEDAEKLPNLKGMLSKDRLSRSSTFADQVEQVILEYEKTIQSLESSLSNTRSSLSTSESNLLEREARIVYLDAMTNQLQSRLSKIMDREANGESHLQDLEARLDSVLNGEEKQNVIIQDLRKELARARQSESSAEEYISTLEERLAEAEQDTEVMQREMSRLEHVIERQRSVGKLDNLLSELDTLKQEEAHYTNGDSRASYEDDGTDFFHDRLVATASAQHPHEEYAPEAAEDEWKAFGPMEGDEETRSEFTSTSYDATRAGRAESPRQANGDEKVHSPAQAKAIADKLETMTIELFELRSDHDTTVNELEDVSRKYRIALSTLAELQDAVAPSGKHQSAQSFLDRGLPDSREDGQRLSSRILSSELSSLGESPTLVADSDAGTTPYSETGEYKSPNFSRSVQKDETLAESIRALKRSNAEKDISINQLTENYNQLEDQHNDTLTYINELKEEMQKQQSAPQTPSLLPPAASLARRRSNFGKDREGRVFAALQNLALEHLHGNNEAMRDFETNVNAAMTESQLRQERVDTLEAEVTAAKKELGMKNTMISGLHRERASRSAATTDVALVNTIKEHLLQTQQYITGLQESNRDHQERLAAGVRSFQSRLAAGPTDPTSSLSSTEKRFDDGSQAEAASDGGFGLVSQALGQHEPSSSDLQDELATWDSKHRSTFEAVQALEQQLLATIGGLEASIRNAENINAEGVAARELRSGMHSSSPSSDWEAEKATHVKKIQGLEEEIASYKARLSAHDEKVQHLEKSFLQIQQENTTSSRSRKLTETELRQHRDLVANLEEQIDQQKSLATFHQQGLKSLEESHSQQLDELRATMQREQRESDARLKEEYRKNQEATSTLQTELTQAHMGMARLMDNISAALEEETDQSDLSTRLQALTEDRKSLFTKHTAASAALVSAQDEMQEAKQISKDLQAKVNEMTMANEELIKQLDRSTEKNQKNQKLVADLEEQLNANYEQHKSANVQLSSANKERVETEKELGDYRSRVVLLETQLNEMKRMTSASHRTSDSAEELDRRLSGGSGLRKSGSQASMRKSPAPAVPLPPLPLDGTKSPTARPTTPRPSSREVSYIQQEQATQIIQLANKIEQLEKKLTAEKTLTQTLEEALVDLEAGSNASKKDMEAWRFRAQELEAESRHYRQERDTWKHERDSLRNSTKTMRNSMQQLQEEKTRRQTAEEAQKRLQEQFEQVGKKKKKNALNCF